MLHFSMRIKKVAWLNIQLFQHSWYNGASFNDLLTDVYIVRISPSGVCLVMEFMSEGSLQDLLKRKVHFGEREIAVVAFSVLMGLCEMHELKLIHRDVKV